MGARHGKEKPRSGERGELLARGKKSRR